MFTKEQIKEIEYKLSLLARKDTSFEQALELSKNDKVAIVQNNKNKIISIGDIITHLHLLGSTDFVNITSKFNESYITLNQAIQLIPFISRKIGQLITFLNEDGIWQIYQFKGTRKNQWNNITLWENVISTLLDSKLEADEEDITTKKRGDKYQLKFKDKDYDKDSFSGLGRVYLRKNIVKAIEPSTGKPFYTNLLTNQIINKPNTIYIIQYDYNLNQQGITIPENCILQFEGGSIGNGKIEGKNTRIINSTSNSFINIETTGTWNTELSEPIEGEIKTINVVRDITANQDSITNIENNIDNIEEDIKDIDKDLSGLHEDFNKLPKVDEEDITVGEDNFIKFKNKEYSEKDYSGLGRVYLRKNIVDNRNILTQDMINKPNTIYIIQYDYDLIEKEINIPENCILDFHGGSLNNGELIFNNSKLQGDILINTDVAGTVFNTKLKVEWFGAKGDGINDDSISIRNTIKLLNKNGSVLEFKSSIYIMGDGKEGKDGTGNSYIPHPEFPRRPLQDDLHPSDIGREITLRFINYKNLTIEGNGATIKAHPNNGECKHNTLFYFGVCSFLIINNLNIDGAKDTIIPKFDDYNTGDDIWDDDFNWVNNPKRGYAQRGNMYILGCDTVSLKNIVSNKSVMDGICVGNYRDILSNNINIINCKCLFNYRQGLTLSSVYNTLVQGGEYSFTGYMPDKKTLSGTLPMSGIDVEADSIVNYNINIENVTVDSNYVSGIIFSRQGSNIRVSNSKFINKGVNVVRTAGGRNNEVCYNYFENCSSGIYQENLKVHHNIFKFDENGGDTGFAFDAFLDEGEEYENTSLFSDNIVEVDVSKIEENTAEHYYYGCFRAKAPIIINNNIFKNMYVKNSYAFMANVTSAKDNVFINNSEDFPILSNTMLSLYSGSFTKLYRNYSNDFGIINNRIVGETSSVVFNNDIKSTRLPSRILYSINVAFPSNKEEQWFLLPKIKDIKIRVNINTTSPYTIFIRNNRGGYIENIYYISDYTNDLSTEDLPVILYKNEENKACLKIEKNVFGNVDFDITDTNNSAKDNIKVEKIPPIIDTENLSIMICTDRYQERASDRLKESFKGLNVYDETYNKPLWVNGEGHLVDSNGIPKDVKNKGTSTERPALHMPIGFIYFDTTLNRQIVWDGVKWNILITEDDISNLQKQIDELKKPTE